MNQYPLVSILTTVYNREKYLAACIDSVLASTFQHWELIIVDDGSQDQSVAIAQQYAAKDPRIRVYVNEKNLGDYPNRNRAAAYAKGKYIKYLDADDLMYPHGLKIMVETMEQFPECALGISQQVAEDVKPYPFVMTPAETFRREFLQRGVLGVAPSYTILKREVFVDFNGFSGKRYIGDKEFWYKIALDLPIVKMVPGLVYWRRHEEQEFDLGIKTNTYLIENLKLKLTTIQSSKIPLHKNEKQASIKKIKAQAIREILNIGLKKGEIINALKLWKLSELSIYDFHLFFWNLKIK